MNIGLLNTRIQLQKNAVVVDTIGNHKNSWADYFSCYATVANESGAEKEVAGQTVEPNTVAFTVRYCTETAAITASGYRILWNDEIYDITNIDHQNNKRKTLKIWCKKVRRS